ncbi:hypothetical protein DYB28_012861, partial [Aphanomyces astaci]
DERGFVYNAPVLADPPSFNGSSRSGEYLDQVNALQPNGSRPFAMPVSACMDVFTKKRVGKMLDKLMRALERDDQARVLDQEGKTVVVIMVKPLGLQESVERQLALQRNKLLKSNVYRFVDWLRGHTAGYHLYAPVEDEKTSAPPATAAAAPSRPSKPGRSEGSVGSSSGPPRRAPSPEQDSAKYERKKATCLKCGNENHKMVNCPKCAPGESERLLKEQMDKWESARNKKVTKLQGNANKSLGRDANIQGIVSVTTTLLDTGSDVTLVTAGVMKSLQRAGVEVKVISPEPSVI